MGARKVQSVDDDHVFIWGSDIDSWEWYFMIILFLGMLGTIMRLLPVISGRPAAVESSQSCVLEGTAALGLCSPFCSEDDAIMLRNLIGRTCTLLHTVGGRHAIHGFYLDTILNEKRVKGEENRKNIWRSWMLFLSKLIDLCDEISKRQTEDSLDLYSTSKDS